MNCISLFFCWCIRLISNSVYLPDGQAGVKSVLLHEECLKAVQIWMKGGSTASKRARTRSKKYEILRTSADFSGEDFQNTGTFIVVRSTVFSKSSALTSPLARDAHNALWNSQRTSQVRNHSLYVVICECVVPILHLTSPEIVCAV